jgi:hypothetical protein
VSTRPVDAGREPKQINWQPWIVLAGNMSPGGIGERGDRLGRRRYNQIL